MSPLHLIRDADRGLLSGQMRYANLSRLLYEERHQLRQHESLSRKVLICQPTLIGNHGFFHSHFVADIDLDHCDA